VLVSTVVNVVEAAGEVCKATAWGDPHIVTWDGLKFDAHPAGEAIFLQDSSSSLEIQGRLEKIGPGYRGNPAVTTGVAAKGKDGNYVIQVNLADADSESVAVFGPKEGGICVYNTNVDQNTGVTKVLSGEFDDSGNKHLQCLQACASVSGVTGCEMAWNQGDGSTSDGGGGGGTGCCSNDWKTCNAPECGSTEEACAACSKSWALRGWLPSGALSTCKARWDGCLGDESSCCPGLSCDGNTDWKQCEVDSGGSTVDYNGCFAHTGQVDSGNGDADNSCYVVKNSPNFTPIHFNGHTCNVELFVNGDVKPTLSFSEGDVSVTQSGQDIKIKFTDVLEIDMKVNFWGRCHFSNDFVLHDCNSKQNTVNGLLGTPNGNSQDDWTQRDKTVITLPTGNVGKFFFQPAFDYTKANWILASESESLFDYDGFDNFAKHDDPSEVFDTELEAMVLNPDAVIDGICKGDIQCLIDGELLGAEAANAFMANPAVQRVPAETENNGGNPGVKGDPHFKTWAGEHFEYHGKCDLELLSDPNFANGKGLDVHVRTELIRSWSYVKSAAIRLGNDILEVQGSTKNYEKHYWLNGEYLASLKSFGGFPIEFKALNKKANVITIDLQTKENQEIVVRTYREWIRVEFTNVNKAMYGNTIGILGDFVTGKMIARDGVTVPKSHDDYGQEWQVQSVSKLFQKEEGPQFPAKCIMPRNAHSAHSATLRGRRRLNEETVSDIDAEDACAHVIADDRKDCIYDVLTTGDIDSAGAY